MNTKKPTVFFSLLLSHQICSQEFTDVTDETGLTLTHFTSQTVTAIEDVDHNTINHVSTLNNRTHLMSTWLTGGVAAGDVNNDGWQDLFVIGGDTGQSAMFINQGNGTFANTTQSMGLSVVTGRVAGAVFADYDGDGDLDLFLGGVLNEAPRLLQNNLNNSGTFTDVFTQAFIDYDMDFAPNTFGMTLADFNNDLCLDVYLPHSLTPGGPSPRLRPPNGSTQHLWKSDCQGGFTDVSVSAQIAHLYDDPDIIYARRDQSFSAQFSDLNEDGHMDLLVAGDINTSLVLLNNGDETFANVTDRLIITDRDAMGSFTADLNQDGHMDWFSSNIGGVNLGNRLYQGLGDGRFVNVSQASGILEGHWGWGACAADFNGDRWLDIFHVNGFYYPGNTDPNSPDGRYDNTPAVLFMAQGDGTFIEQAELLGIDDQHEGRGVSCFDFDKDGDIDIAIANHKGPFKLYRNDLQTQPAFINLRLISDSPNSLAIGARITVTSSGNGENQRLVQDIQAGNHFNSASPSNAHFMLGNWSGPLNIHIQWPDNQQKSITGVDLNQYLVITDEDSYSFKDGFDASQ
ncbi:CRTAC1 family protein [Marinicella sediminis]|uniref:CRTAC1 family protein n=1 Tax=Marinicella sediminis TaxID=1792834 RepID=A0ABV7JAM5_9GAMM|nr:CRTAC1 family protein [Marinicella sediminis]